MSQKDYIKLQYAAPYKIKYSSKKKSSEKLLKLTIVLIISIIIIFISSLYFIIKNKRVSMLNSTISLNTNQLISNLPSKPKEQWRYINELKKRDTDLLNFNHSTKLNINNTTKLTNEQRQILEQIGADRYNFITNSSKVANSANVSSSQIIANNLQIELPLQLKLRHQVKQSTNSQEKILVQCGSFKNLEQAELIKANLAFIGLESRISLADDWYRIILGPYKKETAKKIRDQAKSVGISSCILRTSKG